MDGTPENGLSWPSRAAVRLHAAPARHGKGQALKGVLLMLKTVLAAVLAAGLVTALVPPSFAAPYMRLAESAAPKPLTPQQQKMKDCGAKWQEEKAKTGVKGGTAYRKFISECLKKAPA
jgi:psiF repeat-containing protein